jgi:hypothetical protein
MTCRTCTKCGETKPLEENFGRSKRGRDGYHSQCKRCRSAASAAWNRRNRDRLEASDEKWKAQYPERLRETRRKARRKSRQTAKGRAKSAVYRAVRSGRLKKPEVCSGCGQEFDKAEIHGHHEDYSKPLDVIWLCHQCHVDVHRDRKLAR